MGFAVLGAMGSSRRWQVTVVQWPKISKSLRLIAFPSRLAAVVAACLSFVAGGAAIATPQSAVAAGSNATSATDVPNPDAYSCIQPGFVGFEKLADGTSLPGTIAGLDFVTTGGHTWLVGDFATGNYNGK
ncbi:MAG TPA: hypothetical protein VES97_03380, partial [Solirubrobacteraceae bacterium]|nr:hypothetical protein [Solirubrobacteraceae bacterium]